MVLPFHIFFPVGRGERERYALPSSVLETTSWVYVLHGYFKFYLDSESSSLTFDTFDLCELFAQLFALLHCYFTQYIPLTDQR